MATAVLTVTTGVNITLGGIVYDFTKVLNIPNVENVRNFQRSVATSVENLLSIGAGLDIEDIDFCIITNEDPLNFVTIGLKVTGGDTSYHRVDAGKYLVVSNRKLDVNITGAVVAAFTDINVITGQFDDSAGIVTLFAAKTQ